MYWSISTSSSVPVAGGDLLVFVQREGGGRRGPQPHAVRPRPLGQPQPEPSQVGIGLSHGLADDGARLKHTLHQLGLQLLAEIGGSSLVQQLLDTDTSSKLSASSSMYPPPPPP